MVDVFVGMVVGDAGCGFGLVGLFWCLVVCSVLPVFEFWLMLMLCLGVFAAAGGFGWLCYLW